MHMEHFHKLGAFMPRRIAAVIKAKGGAMLYWLPIVKQWHFNVYWYIEKLSVYVQLKCLAKIYKVSEGAL